MIMYEGVDRSCYDHSHCEAGMMCTAGGQFRKSNFRVANLGQCSDCYYATHSDRDSAVLAIETLVFRFDRTTRAESNPHEIKRKSNESELGSHWAQYCASTDDSPKTCDYIHDNVRLMSGKAMLVLVFVAINLVNAILKDMDQGQHMQVLIRFRLGMDRAGISSHDESRKVLGLVSIDRHRVVNVMRNASLKLRKYLLPTFIVGATCSILVQSELTCAVILMNGLAIGFATEMDDIIIDLLVHASALRSIDDAFNEMARAGPDQYDPFAGHGEGWLVRRIYACALTFEILYVVLNLEHALQTFSSAPPGEEFLCEWVSVGIFDFNLYVGVSMACLGTAISHSKKYMHKKNKKWAFWVFDCVTTPLFCLMVAEFVMAIAKTASFLRGAADDDDADDADGFSPTPLPTRAPRRF